MKHISIKNNDRILILAPHPDDEAIGTGGLLCMYPQQCTVIIATDGRNADKTVPPEKMAHARSKELSEAMSVSGVKDYTELGVNDGELFNHSDCFSAVDFSLYSKVFVPHRKELHPDHMSCYSFAIKEIKRQKADVEIYQYETRKAFDSADFYLDITSVIDNKMKMIESYRSQIKIFDHASYVKAINSYVASQAGHMYSFFEAYTRYTINELEEKKIDETAVSIARYRKENEILSAWLEFEAEGNKIAAELVYRGWKNAAIYGYGKLGRLLYKKLELDSFTVKYALDRRASEMKNDMIKIYEPDKKHNDVDVVIITALADNNAIGEKMKLLGYRNVFFLGELFIKTKENSN